MPNPPKPQPEGRVRRSDILSTQFEQTFNACYVDKLGYGAWREDVGKEQIESFLFNLPFYSDNLHSHPRAQAIARFWPKWMS